MNNAAILVRHLQRSREARLRAEMVEARARGAIMAIVSMEDWTIPLVELNMDINGVGLLESMRDAAAGIVQQTEDALSRLRDGISSQAR